MVVIEVEYLGDLHCRAIHGPSGNVLLTDAPVDNQGKGEYFSPTDLLATAVGTCILTIMGIVARNHNIPIEGLKVVVTKEMMNVPYRRVKKLQLDFAFPNPLSQKEFEMLRNVINTCPVTRSLNPEVEFEANFNYVPKD